MAAHESSKSSSQGHTPGAVRDPEHDRRLKENRDAGMRKESRSQEHGNTPGAVRDPEHDGRLKGNRDRGIHKSDAEK